MNSSQMFGKSRIFIRERDGMDAEASTTGKSVPMMLSDWKEILIDT